MSLEKNVVKAPILYQSTDGQSHLYPEENYFCKLRNFYKKIATKIEKRFKKEKINPEEDYEIF